MQRVHAEVLEGLLGGGRDVLGREDVAELVGRSAGPLAISRRDLYRDGGAAPADLVLQLFTNHALAVAVAICQSRVEKRDALRDRLVQRLAALVVVHAAPHLTPESPRAEADFADAVAGVAEWSSFHGRDPPPVSKLPLSTSRSGVRRNSAANAGTAFVIKSEKRAVASPSRATSTSCTASCCVVGAKSAPFSAMSDCSAASRP